MAKVRSNNSGGQKKYTTNKVNTKDYNEVYTKEQQVKMNNEFGGDIRSKAAATKTDLGNDKLPRYRYGTQGHQNSAHQSLENQVRRTAENKAGTGTTPENKAATTAMVERTETKTDKYAASDDDKEKARIEANKKDAKDKPIYKYKGR